ncbi:MAG TPA: flavin reductase family protein, partial [Euzebya sp.]|nr:flavin reductase family protein [Euzebya sp.]
TGNGVFAVNVLTEEQEPLSRSFSSKQRPQGTTAFADVAHHTAVTGSPILDSCAAYLDCVVHAEHVAGDHTIYIGEVQALASDADAKPLLFHNGRYAAVTP